MPKNLVVMLTSELYDHMGDHVLSKMVKSKTGPRPQQVCRQIVPIPLRDYSKYLPRRETSKSTSRISKLFQRNPKVKEEPDISPTAEAVAGAYTFLAHRYAPGDKIILVGVSGVKEDSKTVRDTAADLAKHIADGTKPFSPPPLPQPREEVNPWAAMDVPVEPPNLLFKNKIDISCVTLIHRSENRDLGALHDELFHDFPISIKRLFSFNWATDLESWCNTVRDPSGQLTLRETCFYKSAVWQGSLMVHATMSFIHYATEHTICWAGLTPKIVNSQQSPTPGTPLLSDSPTLSAPSEMSNSAPHGDNESSSESDNAVSHNEPTSSSTAVSFNSQSEAGSSRSKGKQTASSPEASNTGFSSQTQVMPTSSDQSPSTPLSFLHPSGMNKHEILTYPQYGNRRDNHFLPQRIVWRAWRA